MKKFLAIVLAVAMMATVAVSVSASSATPNDTLVTVTNPDWLCGTADNKAIYEDIQYSWGEESGLYNYSERKVVIEFVPEMTVQGLKDLGFYAVDEILEILASGITAGKDDLTTFTVVQTSGANVGTVSGSYDVVTNRLTLTYVSNPYAPYVDLRNIEYSIIASYNTLGAVNNNALQGIWTPGLKVEATAPYYLWILPNGFTSLTGNVVDGFTFAGGTTWLQTQTDLYSEMLKGYKVSFNVMDMSALAPYDVTVSFDKFALVEPVNFVYKSAYQDADYENVLAVVDFQAAGRVLNDVGYVTLNASGSLGGFNLAGYSTGDLFNVYFDGQLVEEGVALAYDAKTGVSSLTFKLYNPTSTTSMLGKYVIAKAPVVVEEAPSANPEMGADSVINVAIALAAVSLAAAGFVAVKKSK